MMLALQLAGAGLLVYVLLVVVVAGLLKLKDATHG